MTWAVGGDKPRPYVSAFDEGPPIGHAPCRGGPCGRPPKPGGGTQMTPIEAMNLLYELKQML